LKAWKGRLGLTGVGALGFVTFLTVFAPMATAAPVMFRAPFHGAQPIATSAPFAQGPGAQVVVLVPATFSVISGAAKVGVQLSAVAGASPTFATFASTIGLQGLAFTAPTAGSHLVTAGWTVSYRADLAVVQKAPHLPSGIQITLVVRASMQVFEQSTGKAMPGGQTTLTLIQKSLMTGTFKAVEGLGSVVLTTTPLGLQAGHVYSIATALSVSVVVLVTPAASLGSTATATFLLGAPRTVLASVLVA